MPRAGIPSATMSPAPWSLASAKRAISCFETPRAACESSCAPSSPSSVIPGRRWWSAALTLVLAGGGVSCEASPRFAVDGARALRGVTFQVEAGPRLPATPGHERVRGWIESEVRRLGGRLESQRFTDTTFGKPEELTNVIGHWGPATAGVGAIVLCAHYDTPPQCDEDPDPPQ